MEGERVERGGGDGGREGERREQGRWSDSGVIDTFL